jgi:GT2 family glycosyltransferase
VLDSLAAQSVPVRTIVVDNAGPADVAEIVARHDFAEHLRLEENVGFGRAVNRGAAESREDVLVLVNDDCVCHPGFVDEIVDAIDPADGVTMAAGVLVEARDEKTIDTAGVMIDATLLGSDYMNGMPLDSIGPETPAPAGPSGGAAAFDRSAFAEVGGFDENLFAYWEDVDLTLRLLRAGGRCALATRAVGTHEHSATLGSGSSRKNYLMGWGRGYLLRKWSVIDSPGRALGTLANDGMLCGGQLVLERTTSGVHGRIAGFRAAGDVPREPYPADVLRAAPRSHGTLGRRLKRYRRRHSRPVAHG